MEKGWLDLAWKQLLFQRSLVINPAQVAAIIMLILCAMDLFAVSKFHRHYDFDQLRILTPAALAAIAAGVSLMNLLPVKRLNRSFLYQETLLNQTNLSFFQSL